jgi:hypothetical protein
MAKYSKESLEKLLFLIDEICKEEENLWFRNDLLSKLSSNNHTSAGKEIFLDLKKDTSKIIYFLDINPSCSIDYSFINHKLLRTRLELDNLRMENVRYDLKEKDEMKRLYDFCINAFYQIENLINYYYHEKYPKINDLLNHLEGIENIPFKRKEERNVGDVQIFIKIFAFNKTFYPDDYTGYNIDSLRLVRNEGLHRCSRIKNIETENKRLHDFLKYATFNSVHSLVNSLAIKVKENLNVKNNLEYKK